MFKTTTGIILKVTQYKDRQFIANIYTRDSGIIGLIIRKTKEHIILSQPLTIAEITYRHSNNRSLFYVKEASVEYAYSDLIFNNRKLNKAVILCELLSQLLTEKNHEIYDFTVNSLIWLDKTQNDYTGFINLFLMKFCKIAGIGPTSNLVDSNEAYFQLNIADGVFQKHNNKDESNQLTPTLESRIIKHLCEIEFNDLQNQKTSSELHDSVFNYIINYISVHLSNIKSIKSLNIIKELM